jgi:hypothetical protein
VLFHMPPPVPSQAPSNTSPLRNFFVAASTPHAP